MNYSHLVYIIKLLIFTQGGLSMKKIISVLTVIAMMAVIFCGCSKPNAELTESNVTKTVDVAFSALKNFDTEDLQTYVNSSTLDLIITYANQHQQFVDLGKAIFKNLDYQIKDIDLENKTVTVSVTNKNLRDAAQSFVEKLTSAYTTFQILGKLSNETWLNQKLDELTSAINESQMNDGYIDITLNIEQSGDHLVLSFDDDAEDAVSGGAITAIKSVFGK